MASHAGTLDDRPWVVRALARGVSRAASAARRLGLAGAVALGIVMRTAYGWLGAGAVTVSAWGVDWRLGCLVAGAFLLVKDHQATPGRPT